MARRLMLAMVMCALLAGGFAARASGCGGNGGTATTNYAGSMTFGTITISFSELQDTDVCPGSAPAQGAARGRLAIKDGDVILCETTDVDPSFDPFLFGAGVHSKPEAACGADFTTLSITNPTTPDPAGTGVDAEGEAINAGTTKSTTMETPGSYWWPDGRGVIPQDTPGTVTRGARLAHS